MHTLVQPPAGERLPFAAHRAYEGDFSCLGVTNVPLRVWNVKKDEALTPELELELELEEVLTSVRRSSSTRDGLPVIVLVANKSTHLQPLVFGGPRL
ncbi:unnamed protein product [Somion occarium]|uniref:Uncharacterized protein n=1 Tax=Somion occarium TaxID=3059160 RepID=A0ABP1DM66_9APHY